MHISIISISPALGFHVPKAGDLISPGLRTACPQPWGFHSPSLWDLDPHSFFTISLMLEISFPQPLGFRVRSVGDFMLHAQKNGKDDGNGDGDDDADLFTSQNAIN